MTRFTASLTLAANSLRALLRPRALLTFERAFLAREFADSLELDRLRIAGGGHPIGRSAWQPMAAWIQLSDVCFEHADPTQPVRALALPILAHEALHVWQRVHGQSVVSVSVDGLWLGIARGRAAYDYDRTLTDPRQLLQAFQAGNIEQQGQIFEDYVRSNIHDAAARDPRFAEVANFVCSHRTKRAAGASRARR